MDIEYIVYTIQHSVGIKPKWERKLISEDTQLKMYLEWKTSGKCCPHQCEKLYHNRLNYLKGWLK